MEEKVRKNEQIKHTQCPFCSFINSSFSFFICLLCSIFNISIHLNSFRLRGKFAQFTGLDFLEFTHFLLDYVQTFQGANSVSSSPFLFISLTPTLRFTLSCTNAIPPLGVACELFQKTFSKFFVIFFSNFTFFSIPNGGCESARRGSDSGAKIGLWRAGGQAEGSASVGRLDSTAV